MRREEARPPASDKVFPLNSINSLNSLNSSGNDPFDGECRHGLSDPHWCNICSKNLEAQATLTSQGHNVPLSPRA
jgi:hypothetical protein